MLTYAPGAAFTYSPMVDMEKLVQKGTFDPVLIRPLNPYLTLTAQMFNVGYLGHIILSGAILIWALGQVDVAWNMGLATFLALSILSGMLIQAAALTFVGGWTFTLVRSDVLFWFYGAMRDFQNFPTPIFGTAIQILLTTIVPLAFVNFYPAMIVLGKDSGAVPEVVGWLTPLIGPVAFWLAYRSWMRGVDQYQGAGG